MPIVGQFGSLAGMGSFILPGGAMESIATVTVGSGGASSIEFVDIPGGFSHLQVRMIARSTASATLSYALLRFNTDSGSNYAWHNLSGNGSAASAAGGASATEGYVEKFTGDTATASIYGAAVIDILDYASTSKNKTVRLLGGHDANGSGSLFLYSNLWMSTNAITKIALTPNSGNWKQYSTAALFGIR